MIAAQKGPPMSDETKLTEADFNRIVLELSKKLNQMMLDESQHIKPSIRWLVMSRVINWVFQNHYGNSLREVEDIQKRFAEAPHSCHKNHPEIVTTTPEKDG